MTAVTHPGDLLTRRRRTATIVVLGLLTALGPFTIDLYLPAFPVLAEDIGATDGQVQLTLAATTLGFALGQLVLGPLSDRLGRRWPLVATSSLHVLTSIGIAVAPDIEVLTVLRVLQGIGAAGGAVVAMAMVRDLFSGRSLVRYLSRLALIMGLAPILAPVIGSWLLGVTQWRGIFWVLALYGAVVILLVSTLLRETLPPERRLRTSGMGALGSYRRVLGDRRFIGVAIIGSSGFAGIFAYLSTSPLLLQEVYGLSATQFGGVFALCSVGVFVGVQTSSRLATRFGPQWVLAGSTAGMVVAAIAMLVLDRSGAGLAGFIPAMAAFTLSFGLTMPCVQVLALVEHGSEAGTAASLIGASNMLLASVVGGLIGNFAVRDAVPMGAVMLGGGLLATASLWLLVRPRSVPALSD
ncbi:multidrug effflux MFS transporter [Agrococcus versicolor]|uniref:Multidrug effflux MFS transporter n=1 Tax=Agrococcus versicolor TaxID=501482 RepID=A0ABP5MQW9_9MICO